MKRHAEWTRNKGKSMAETRIITITIGIFLLPFVLLPSVGCSEVAEPVEEAVTEVTQIEPWVPPIQPTRYPLEEPDEQVTILELNRAYIGNELAADAKYKDKILRITGIVAVIERNNDGTLSMALTSTQFSSDAVWFSFDKKYESGLAQLTIGQSVTVQGRCVGDFFGVHVNDCILIH